MRRIATLTVLLLSVSAYSAIPSKAVFQRIYEKLSVAFEQKNEKDFFAILAPDFRQVLPGKTPMTRAQIVADFKIQMDSLSNVKWVREVKSVKQAVRYIHGNRSVKASNNGYDVTVVGHLTASMKGKDGKLHKLVLDGETLDHWTTSMQIEQATVSRYQMTVDGKKVS